jgi:hypothetical protein
VVDTVPWGPDTKVDIGLSAASIFATLLISLFLWWYDWRSGRRQERHDNELRLQEHAKLLSNTDAMHIIDEFEQQCSDMFADLPDDATKPNYGTVFRHRKQISRNGISVTRASLRGVNAARKELQGIWDNICGDYKSDRLPGAITDGSNSRIFKRAQTYMAAAEPLEAANRGRMEDRGHVQPRPPYLGMSPGYTSAGQQYPTFYHGVRPWRFFWLEDQLAMKLTAGKSKLWQEKGRPAAGQHSIPEEAKLIGVTWDNFTEDQREQFSKHWAAVKAAYRAVPAGFPAAAPAQQQGGQSSGGAAAAAGSSSSSSSSSATTGPSSDNLTQLVARQNALLEQLLALMQQQWPEAAAAVAAQ